MKSQLDQRLEQPRSEYGAGQQMLADFENRKAGLQNTLLHISGAI